MTASRRLKVTLVAAMVAGLLGFFAVPRVSALFTSEGSNLGSSAQTGTFTMDVKVGPSGSACFSYNGTSNTNTSCAALATYSPAAELFPGEPVTIPVTIDNDGSLPATDLRVYMPGGCTAGTTGDVPTGGAGGGNPCGSSGFQLSIQENNADGSKTCWFPSASGACAFSSPISSLAIRQTVSAGLSLGAGPAAQKSRSFLIGVQIPSNDPNTLQGEQISFTLAWHMTS